MTARGILPFIRRIADVVKVIVGVPSYRIYCEHMERRHPGEAIMSAAEFFRNRQDARYARGKGTRCC